MILPAYWNRTISATTCIILTEQWKVHLVPSGGEAFSPPDSVAFSAFGRDGKIGEVMKESLACQSLLTLSLRAATVPSGNTGSLERMSPKEVLNPFHVRWGQSNFLQYACICHRMQNIEELRSNAETIPILLPNMARICKLSTHSRLQSQEQLIHTTSMINDILFSCGS
jgi:hypothetical protein